MEVDTKSGKKRKSVKSEVHQSKRSRGLDDSYVATNESKAGKIQRILMRNFMCHDALEVQLNPNVNFIVGRNGSGKSAILTALTIGLGARANITSRGASVKGFVKKGKHSATIEVTLLNSGPLAYKPESYGSTITVFRRIGASSEYKIKNWKGEVVSTKRNELDNILRSMNIQIDNPISILNQDISRTFLVSSKPEEKYELFMKATLLDVIGHNYKEAEFICQEEYTKLQQYNEILSDTKREMDQLKMNIKRAEEIEESRKEVIELEMELCWSIAISEEANLRKTEGIFKTCENSLKELQHNESCVETKNEQINTKIREIQEEMKCVERESSDSTESYNKVKREFYTCKDKHHVKSHEWRCVQSKIQRYEDDINTIRKEIHRLESGDNAEQSERNQLKQQLADYEQKLDEIEAMLRTTQTSQMHLGTDKMRLQKELQSAKIEINSCEGRIQNIKRKLGTIKQQSDSSLAVFGRNMPRLVRRIEEEYKNGRFRKKPRGPFGAHIKLKDQAWVPAVENYLGAGAFSTFCVDNSEDAKTLNFIVKEIFLNERPPQVICSKFCEKVHDVSKNCTRAPGYSNLLDAMVITDPVVANCLIDQRDIECILLIPTSKEACSLLSDASRVPRNCKRAFTQRADTFYPDPHYRTYGGPRHLRSQYLQVSSADAKDTLEEELRATTSEKATAAQAYATACEKEKRTSSELESVKMKLAKLNRARDQYKIKINDLKDKIASNEAISLTVLGNELAELEKKLEQEKATETQLGESVLEIQRSIDSLQAEIKRYGELQQNLEMKLNPLRESIKELQEERERIRSKSMNAVRKLQAARQTLQNATAEYETQQRVTEKAVSNAMKQCSRIDTQRSAGDLETLIRNLKRKIRDVEQLFGSLEQLRDELKEKEAKYGKHIQLTTNMEKSYQAQLKRLNDRKELFSDMKHKYGLNIQKSFSDVLALRNKKGVIRIDHARKVLELEVTSSSDSKKATNDARSLSGGERSYSTVAFILALWDCTGLPFYFLDEFDVFMDKVNRRVIMDILLDHTKTHPQSQFTFLTPLDTSNILAEDYVTIHRLTPPERGSQS